MSNEIIKNGSWHEEHTFWFTKFSRALVRYNAAEKSYDHEALDVAAKQMDLYSRRMKAVVPEDVKESIRQKREVERIAALNDE